MAILSSGDRKSLPANKFAEPGKRAFPLTDKTHDREAISGATRSEHAGNISSSEENHIKSEAREKLGEGDAKGAGDAHTKAKAAVAKMHPTHVHKIMQDAHAGKFGPEAQKTAQQAMQGGGSSPMQSGDADGDNDSTAVPGPPQNFNSMFSGSGGAQAQQPQAPPQGNKFSSMFGGR